MTTYHSRDGVTSQLRMRGHDYASAASYFVTLCTQRRVCLFSEVRDGWMCPRPAGVMVDSWWHFIPSRFSSVMLDAMVVMPNHIHAVIHIGSDPEKTDTTPPLGDVVRWFKIRTTYDYTHGVKTEAWPRFPGRLWQEKYYDHIIRNELEMDRIRMYIEGNPGKWGDVEYNPQALAQSK